MKLKQLLFELVDSLQTFIGKRGPDQEWKENLGDKLQKCFIVYLQIKVKVVNGTKQTSKETKPKTVCRIGDGSFGEKSKLLYQTFNCCWCHVDAAAAAVLYCFVLFRCFSFLFVCFVTLALFFFFSWSTLCRLLGINSLPCKALTFSSRKVAIACFLLL